jgi:hypothetical protein
MRDIEQARSLVRLAHRDWMALTGMQGSPLFADEIFGFHAQQAVEKALKAWLCAKDQTYPLTHELLRLLALLENLDADAEPFWPLARFTPYAVQARYEEGPPEADEVLDRPAVVAEVQVLLRHVAIIVGEQGI